MGEPTLSLELPGDEKPSRAPHPKKLSRETASALHRGEIELPDANALREVSPHNPPEHSLDDEEMAKTKAERFAILAHLIAHVADKVLVGEGDRVRFIHRVPEVNRDFPPDVFGKLEYDLMDLLKTDIVKNSIESVRTNAALQPAITRLREISKQISESTDGKSYSEPVDILDPSAGKVPEDPIENRLFVPSTELVLSCVKMLELLEYHYRGLKQKLTAEQKREVAIQNIGVLEELAALNITHFEKSLHTTWAWYEDNYEPEHVEFDTEFFDANVDSELVQENGKWKLIIKNKNPKPKQGLMGATLGCPAGYDLGEGDNALRKAAIAIINEAYDRGIFGSQ